MRILITGVSGMLGTALVRELSAGFEIIGVDLRREPPFPAFSRITFHQADITSADKIVALVGRLSPGIIIHAAALTDVDGCERNPRLAEQINVTGSKNVALAAKETGATTLYLSTDFVFDGESARPYKETDSPRPLSVYARTKLKGEEIIRAFVPRHQIVRTSWLFGPGGKNFIDTIIARAEAGEELRVVEDQVGSPTYTVDLARAIRALIEKTRNQKSGVRSQRPQGVPSEALSLPKGEVEGKSEIRSQESEAQSFSEGGVEGKAEELYGVYHVANQGNCSWYELARRALNYAGIETVIQPITSEQLARPARRPKMSILDCGRFQKVTGHFLRPWPEALKEYVQMKFRPQPTVDGPP